MYEMHLQDHGAKTYIVHIDGWGWLEFAGEKLVNIRHRDDLPNASIDLDELNLDELVQGALRFVAGELYWPRVLDDLRKKGVEELTVEFSGEGDNGGIEEITSTPVDLPRAVTKELTDSLYRSVAYPSGFEDGNGGRGEIILNIKDETVITWLSSFGFETRTNLLETKPLILPTHHRWVGMLGLSQGLLSLPPVPAINLIRRWNKACLNRASFSEARARFCAAWMRLYHPILSRRMANRLAFREGHELCEPLAEELSEALMNPQVAVTWPLDPDPLVCLAQEAEALGLHKVTVINDEYYGIEIRTNIDDIPLEDMMSPESINELQDAVLDSGGQVVELDILQQKIRISERWEEEVTSEPREFYAYQRNIASFEEHFGARPH